MVETLKSNGQWHIDLARIDLIEQGGLNEESLVAGRGYLRYHDRRMMITHNIGDHLVVSFEGERDQETHRLINAFSDIVGYEPFCYYDLKTRAWEKIPTYEWAKRDSEKRFKVLENQRGVSHLERI